MARLWECKLGIIDSKCAGEIVRLPDWDIVRWDCQMRQCAMRCQIEVHCWWDIVMARLWECKLEIVKSKAKVLDCHHCEIFIVLSLSWFENDCQIVRWVGWMVGWLDDSARLSPGWLEKAAKMEEEAKVKISEIRRQNVLWTVFF